MRIKYNSPAILTYALISVVVLVLSEYLFPPTRGLFTVSGSYGSLLNPLNFFRLFSHIAGHGSWSHLLGNFTFILLLGPMLEERYGSGKLILMILLTGAVTGLLNIILFSSGLLGASGIVFMLIILSSISNAKSGEIPLTFILVAALYIGTELLNSLRLDNISQFAHILGGICGALFGFSLGSSSSTQSTE